MLLSDLHTHTHFSFDSKELPEKSCEAAIKKGISVIAITNHCDYDGILTGIYPTYDFEADAEEIRMVGKKYAAKLRVLHGIEVGQPQLYPVMLKELIAKWQFDYVIGAVHNLKDVPDFAFLNFTDMTQRQIEMLFERYLSEYAQMVECEGVMTAAHLTYPLRYIMKCGRNLELSAYYPQIASIFGTIIRRGINLEVNTSGFRQGMGCSMPDYGLVKLYRECGGKRIVCCSDAHHSKDIGAHIEETYRDLAGFGFTTIGEI